MYTYLKSKGVEVVSDKAAWGKADRDKNFNIKDPTATSWKSWDPAG